MFPIYTGIQALCWPCTTQYRLILTQYLLVPLIIHHFVRHSWIISPFMIQLMSHAQYTWSSSVVFEWVSVSGIGNTRLNLHFFQYILIRPLVTIFCPYFQWEEQQQQELLSQRGSHGLSARRAQRTKSSRPKGPPTRCWGPEGPLTSSS